MSISVHVFPCESLSTGLVIIGNAATETITIKRSFAAGVNDKHVIVFVSVDDPNTRLNVSDATFVYFLCGLNTQSGISVSVARIVRGANGYECCGKSIAGHVAFLRARTPYVCE